MERLEPSCQNCNSTFNMLDKVEMMLGCGDTVCLVCLQKLLDPESDKIICPYDQEELMITKKFRERVAGMVKEKKEIL